MNKNNIPEAWNIIVLPHAISRLRERGSNPNMSDMNAANQIRCIIESGREMVLKDKVEEVKQMMKHDFKPARYFKTGQVMVVLQDRTVMTVHGAEAGKWKQKH